MMRRAWFGLGAWLFIAGGPACAGPSDPITEDDTGQPFRIPVTIRTGTGPVVFQAEIADTREERNQGLMFRTELADDHGMLFLFPGESQQRFWMRNTLIPLDMIFIRADRTILGIVENAEPETDVQRSVPGLSQFVLEINGGLSARLGIEAGQSVEFMAPIPER